MPIIRVEMFSGRTPEQKKAMVKELTDAFVRTAGGKPEAVHVVVSDVDKDHWAVAGELCSERYPDKKP